MTREVPESDWRTFRELREVALERFCKRVLDDVRPLTETSSGSYHERYLEIFRVLGDRNEALARAFDNPRRSQMLFQLVAIGQLELLTPEEWDRFRPDTLQKVQMLQGLV